MSVRENKTQSQIVGRHIHTEKWISVTHSTLDLTVVILTFLNSLKTVEIVDKTKQL
jgi:hypothetical protein